MALTLWNTTKQLDAADDDAIAESQSPGAGDISLDGTLVSGGVATLDTPRRVLITSGGDDSGITFTVTGTNYAGNSISETVVGTNGSTVATNLDFATVTAVTASGAVTGTLIVGTNGVGSSPWFFVDRGVNTIEIGVGVVVSGTVNYDVEYTYDDPNDPYTVSGYPTPFNSSLANSAVNGDVAIKAPVVAVRLTINSGTGTAKAVFTQSGVAN